jgi:anaerobic selenocysteine-containing dehydrogenase
MHPADAQARGLSEGAWVKVWNGLGEVHLPLSITDAIKADLSEGACHNDARVEVAALSALRGGPLEEI